MLDPHIPARRHQPHRRKRMRIVRRELGIEGRGGRDQRVGADQIGQIGRGLGGEDRIAGTARHLRFLDLAIPIGALDQANHDPAAAILGQVLQRLDHREAALLIGLDHYAKPGPATQLRFAHQPLDHLERQDETIGLLRVDREIEVVLGRDQSEPLHARIELVPDALLLHRLITRAECGKLDRNAMPVLGRGTRRARAADRLDRVRIDGLVPLGIGRGARTFAEHVERTGIAFLLRALQRRFDSAAEHELLAHHLDRGAHRLADHGFADARGQPLEPAAEIGLRILVDIDQLAGEHQPPGRGIHEQAVRLAEMARPIGRSDFLGDQAVARLGIGRAQQRFGEAHQRQPLARAEGELLEEAFHHALLLGGLARGADHLGRLALDRTAFLGRKRRAREQGTASRRLVLIFEPIDTVPVEPVGHAKTSHGICGRYISR